MDGGRLLWILDASINLCMESSYSTIGEEETSG